jgi:hypothetical protein
MCSISHEIKFCTCTPNKKNLNNYWVLFRYKPEKNEYMMGEPMMPTELRDPEFYMNSAILCSRLNEPEAFDKPISFKEKDKLLVVIDANENDYEYTFEFLNGKWENAEEDPFDLINQFKKIQKGECK